MGSFCAYIIYSSPINGGGILFTIKVMVILLSGGGQRGDVVSEQGSDNSELSSRRYVRIIEAQCRDYKIPTQQGIPPVAEEKLLTQPLQDLSSRLRHA